MPMYVVLRIHVQIMLGSCIAMNVIQVLILLGKHLEHNRNVICNYFLLPITANRDPPIIPA